MPGRQLGFGKEKNGISLDIQKLLSPKMRKTEQIVSQTAQPHRNTMLNFDHFGKLENHNDEALSITLKVEDPIQESPEKLVEPSSSSA